jgi:hypothetical protein
VLLKRCSRRAARSGDRDGMLGWRRNIRMFANVGHYLFAMVLPRSCLTDVQFRMARLPTAGFAWSQHSVVNLPGL